MRKLVLALVVALLAVPAFAAAPALDLVAGTGGVVTLNYTTNGSLISGMGLKITATNGAVFSNYADGAQGTAYWVHPTNFTYDGTTVVKGSAVASNDANGLMLEYGALYVRPGTGDPNKPATSGTLCTFKVDKNCTVTVVSDYAGGVVTEDFNSFTTLTDSVAVTFALCPGDVTGTITGLVTGPPPTFTKTFDENRWTGPNGRTDTTDLQALIYLLTWKGTALVVTPVPAKAAAGDITGTATGLVTGPPPTFTKTFSQSRWTGPNGRVDTTDIQALTYLLTWNGTSLIYTCP